MISLVVAGRNDDYGGGFGARLLRSCVHNSRALLAAGLDLEIVFVEWNPLPDRPWQCEQLLAAVPQARAIVVPPEVHRRRVSNPYLAFDEMAAKNVGIRRALGSLVVVLNADVLLGPDVIAALADPTLRNDTLYRAQRIDVPSAVPDERLTDPAMALPSSEQRPPAPFLGAVGDFCAASSRLWHELGGFNERVTFSTRAKDWQFCLAALAHQVPVQFIGHVYHLEHAGGFRNTPSHERNEEQVHFGGLWDIEFELSHRNPGTWGLAHAGSTATADRIECLDAGADQPLRPADTILNTWLRRPNGTPDHATAAMMHAVLHADATGCPLGVVVENGPDAIALAGVVSIAAEFGIGVRCDWKWPACDGFRWPAFSPLTGSDFRGGRLLRREGHRWTLRDQATGEAVPFLPQRARADGPVFNPMLARRLLRALLRVRHAGARRVAIFGAGSHTADLLSLGLPDDIDCPMLVVSGSADNHTNHPANRPVRNIDEIDPGAVDAILVSSIPHEAAMTARALDAGFAHVVPLWDTDLPLSSVSCCR